MRPRPLRSSRLQTPPKRPGLRWKMARRCPAQPWTSLISIGFWPVLSRVRPENPMPPVRLFIGVCGICLALGIAPFAQGRADEPNVIRVRVGNHPGFGRVVFDLPPDTKFALAREGNRVRLVFPAGEPVLVGNSPPRNVLAIEGGAGTAVLELTPGSKIRTLRLGDRLALDVLDPPRSTRSDISKTPPAASASAPAAPGTPPKPAEPAAATPPPASQSSSSGPELRPELPAPPPIPPIE